MFNDEIQNSSVYESKEEQGEQEVQDVGEVRTGVRSARRKTIIEQDVIAVSDVDQFETR